MNPIISPTMDELVLQLFFWNEEFDTMVDMSLKPNDEDNLAYNLEPVIGIQAQGKNYKFRKLLRINPLPYHLARYKNKEFLLNIIIVYFPSPKFFCKLSKNWLKIKSRW